MRQIHSVELDVGYTVIGGRWTAGETVPRAPQTLLCVLQSASATLQRVVGLLQRERAHFNC